VDASAQAARIDAIRRFNRFYTRRMGLTQEGLRSPTEEGRAAFSERNASQAEVAALLDTLSPPDQERLVEAMAVIQEVLGAAPEHRVPYVLRPPEPGDFGWIVERHGRLYDREYGWGERFEALVAEIVARFVREFDAGRERCWIAERNGVNVGSVALVNEPDREGVARLRLLLVDPSARGLGIGRRLVRECTRFARGAGYHTITLWTDSVLHAARRIYEEEGYRLVREERHDTFGVDLVGQTWELTL
jgi:GNAT superfamily N-acetyltransferase